MGSEAAPWLSVLMPVYNGAATLGDSLTSLVGQADGIEVILVDQASDDDSCEVAKGFCNRLDLRIISAPDNKNWVQNTNLALSLARAPRATMLHQDDLWRPGRAALLRRMFDAHPDAALWVHGADYIDDKGRMVGRLTPPFGRRAGLVPSQQALARLMVQNTVAIPAPAFSVALARRDGGLDPSLWYTADWDFWLRLMRGGDLAWSPECAAAFRLHAGSLTVTGSRDGAGFRRQLEIPLERHLVALPQPLRRRVARRARASNALNFWMAAAYHGQRPPLAPILWQLLCLGPVGGVAFLRDSRLIARVAARLSLLAKRD